MTQKQELVDRIKAKKKEMEASLHEMRADASKDSRSKAKQLEAKLEELDQRLEDGWDNLTEKGAAKLNKWLDN